MNFLLSRCVAVGAGGFVGTISRYLIGYYFGRFNFRFPLATLLINVTGSMFLGWFLTFIGGKNVSDTVRLAIAVGFVGGYTTFSTYMYDCFKLTDDGAFLLAVLNLIGSLLLGLVGVYLGVLLARSL
jgi:CrcB protein